MAWRRVTRLARVVLFLILLGGLLELAGIGLALREIGNRRREVEAHERRPISAYAVVSLGGSGSLTVGSAQPAEPPLLEQRMEALERALLDLRADQSAAQQRAEQNAKQVAENLTNALQDHLAANIDGVRTLLLNVTRPTASAWWSIRLLVAGLALQTLANVVQVMSPAAGS